MPGPAAAQQWKLRGILLARPATVRGITGDCQCTWQWYTLGLQHGAFRASVTLIHNGPVMAPSYAVLVSMAHNGVEMTNGQVTCEVKQKRCGRTLRLSLAIRHAGVYYLLVHGEGSNSIAYSLSVKGNIYPLKCGIYCR